MFVLPLRELLLDLEKSQPTTPPEQTSTSTAPISAPPTKPRTRFSEASTPSSSLPKSPPTPKRTRLKRNTSNQEETVKESADILDADNFVDTTAGSQASQKLTRPKTAVPATRQQGTATRQQGTPTTGNGRASAGGFRDLQPTGMCPISSIPTMPRERISYESLVLCPICERNIAARDVNAHLDRTCAESQPTKVANAAISAASTVTVKSETMAKSALSSLSIQAQSQLGPSTVTVKSETMAKSTSSSLSIQAQSQLGPSRNQVNMGKKPVKIVYNMYKELALRKLMRDLGLPEHGDRNLLQERHREYINIYNSNLDSLLPKDLREMLRELDAWERDYVSSREAQRANGTNGGKSMAGKGEVEEHNILFLAYYCYCTTVHNIILNFVLPFDQLHPRFSLSQRKYADQFANLITQAKPKPNPKTHSPPTAPDETRNKRPRLDVDQTAVSELDTNSTSQLARIRAITNSLVQARESSAVGVNPMAVVPLSPPQESGPGPSAGE
ncbi:hypothetical protein BC936DRAFT_144427 [Jimgerdemannia flammicorona]|uniref:RING-type E3 ubiquitin transferase n=1 Tax=Jimgerdemannia flammicorona TaxID=994334 RepID=A0A433DCG6_9FUNG|nr:hypothetical protein BC936DRAFT_144427 [Jimgerdemannia flammicorona]